MRYLILSISILTAACGASAVTSPSPVTPAVQQQPAPAAPATCEAIASLRIEGQTITIDLSQPAAVVVDRQQGARLEREDGVKRVSDTRYRGDVHWDNAYVATATCANGATQAKSFRVGPEPSCGICANPPAPVAPPPAVPTPTVQAPCHAAITWIDPEQAAQTDRQMATLSVPCTGLYYVSWGQTSAGEWHRLDVQLFEAGGIHLAGQWRAIYPRWLVELRDWDGAVLSTVEGMTP